MNTTSPYGETRGPGWTWDNYRMEWNYRPPVTGWLNISEPGDHTRTMIGTRQGDPTGLASGPMVFLPVGCTTVTI